MAAGAALRTADVTAIHLRAGDIVYGHYSRGNFFGDKAIPYPLAIDLIARLRAGGVTPLLFGQDADLLAHLRDDHGGYCADDIGDRSGFSPAQNALFDICLLGRCTRIIGGRSAFCKLGAGIAGIERELPASLYEADEAVGIIERHMSDPDASPLISGKQKVFAARYAFMLAGETIARGERFWRLLELARENDPENPLLQFVYACSLYEAGREGEAEAMLSDIFAARPVLAEGVVHCSHVHDADSKTAPIHVLHILASLRFRPGQDTRWRPSVATSTSLQKAVTKPTKHMSAESCESEINSIITINYPPPSRRVNDNRAGKRLRGGGHEYEYKWGEISAMRIFGNREES